jgi:hypothetical protein
MTLYNPANQGQLSSNDSEGGNSCVAYSASYALSDATNGRIHPTGARIRDWTGDHMGGLELAEVDYAIARNAGIDFTTNVFTAGEFYGRLASGYGAILLGGYRPIAQSRYSGQPGFIGNHGIYVPPGLAVMDPLADGRRSGIYRYHGERYPSSLINAFASSLRMSNGNQAGGNHFEASIVHLEASTAKPFTLAAAQGNVQVYRVSGRTILGRAQEHTGGFSGRCSAPSRYDWPRVGAYSLVRMLTGSRKGKYLAQKGTHITVSEV